MIYYENNCTTHLSEKEKRYFLKISKNYRKKKKIKWAIWNTERAKIFYQVNEFSEKFDDKLKLLETKQKKKQMKQTKTTSSWWEWKIIYNSELITQWLASIKDLEKHHKSEKSKKKSAQKLLLNVSEISINQQIQTEQSSEKDNLEEMFTEENEDWYETVLQETKKLEIKKNKNLMTCEWSYWITCHNNKCKKYHKMKKWNQYYSQEFWKYTSQNKKKWSKKSLYKISIER